MKAQNGITFPSEMCFGIMNVTKDSYLLNSKVAFLKSGQNAAGICPFFLRCLGVHLSKKYGCHTQAFFSLFQSFSGYRVTGPILSKQIKNELQTIGI